MDEATDEAVEQGARSLWVTCGHTAFERDWEMTTSEEKRLWRLRARNCINAALAKDRLSALPGDES